jgi:hypothetical protein
MHSHDRDCRRGPRAPFRPALEALDDRLCPSTIQVLGHTMFVLGDAGGNFIRIADYGDGRVQVRIDDQSQTAEGIDSLVVRAGAGDDIIEYSLQSASRTPMSVAAEGGAGDDEIYALLLADISPQGALDLRLDGGAGGDLVFLDTYTGRLNGTLAAELTGGAGDDAVGAFVDASSSNSGTGQLALSLFGDAGNDSLFSAVFGTEMLASSTVAVDGGPGQDTPE